MPAPRNKRPSGSKCFELMRKIRRWAHSETPRRASPVVIVTEKRDGFQIIINKERMDSAGQGIKLLTKQDIEYDPKSKTRLGAIARVVLRNFRKVYTTDIVHPKAGQATRLYAEIVQHDSERGDDLQSMMNGSLDNLKPNRLFVFDCDFKESEKVSVPLTEKLELLKRTLGTEHVVPELFNPRRTQIIHAQLARLENSMNTQEGIVAEVLPGKLVKHKTALPVPLHLVAVGFTEIQCSKATAPATVPTHFAWAFEKGTNEFAVVLIDDRTHFFDPKRKEQGKILIDPTEMVFNAGSGAYACTNKSFAGDNYTALLAMASQLIEPASCDRLTAQAGGRTYTVDKNRRLNFGSAKFFFLKFPKYGVIAANRFWMGGLQRESQDVGRIHLQAPQFLASRTYGENIHRALLPGHGLPEFPEPQPLSAEKLIRIASIPRNARAHAEIVYGYRGVDLVYGEWTKVDEEEETDYYSSAESTPRQSEDETDKDFMDRRWKYDTRLNKNMTQG